MINAPPADVVDRLLWRDAQAILTRHTGPDGTGQCTWCGRAWPCAPRRCAERAAVASRRPWNEAWTARHDLYSLRAAAGWHREFGREGARDDGRDGGRAAGGGRDGGGRGGGGRDGGRERTRGGWHRAGNNRGTF